MLKQNKIVFILILVMFFILTVTIVSAQFCEIENVKDNLAKALFDYFQSPNSGKYNKTELRDLLNFYISSKDSTTVRCDVKGTVSNVNYDTIVTKVSTATKNVAFPSCSDGTRYGKCSATKPLYCFAGQLVNRCKACGCPSADFICQINGTSTSKIDKGAWGECISKKCTDGTSYNNCSITKPLFCSNGTLINDCTSCGCSSGQSCNTTSKTCYATPNVTCSDTDGGNYYVKGIVTFSNSSTINGTFTDSCGWDSNLWEFQCINNSVFTYLYRSCPNGCLDGACINTTCSDGTPNLNCSATKPKYCSNGTLVNNCNSCGCLSGQGCNTTTQTCYSGCTYGPNIIPYGCYSPNYPLYCSYSGLFRSNCSVCGCPSSSPACITNGSCMGICPDGTPELSCSTTKPLYCRWTGSLINNCNLCGCPTGLTCDTTSQTCYVPVIINNSCIDSDGGLNYYLKGTSTLSNGSILTDYCSASFYLTEFYCANNSSFYSYVNCLGGCSNGACLNLTCSDGTPNSNCSTTKPKYCNNGTLINNCNSCGCSSGQTCNTTSQTCYIPAIINNSCIDSDGLNYYNKGAVTFTNGTNLSDYCISSSDLIEQQCVNNFTASWCHDTNGCVSTKRINCLANFSLICSNGACVSNITAPFNLTCSDGTLNSTCSNTKPLFCNNKTLINNCNLCGCASGQSCNTTSKSCYTFTNVTTNNNCIDSDGGINYFLKGTVNHTGFTGTDWCNTFFNGSSYVNDGNLTELYCIPTDNLGNMHSSIVYKCSNGCLNGACVNVTSNTTCTDTDGGDNPYVKGTCTDLNGAHVDSCQNLITAYNDFRCEFYGCQGFGNACPSGYMCQNGACISNGTAKSNTTCQVALTNAAGCVDYCRSYYPNSSTLTQPFDSLLPRSYCVCYDPVTDKKLRECHQDSLTCTDSDEGLNYGVKGTVSSNIESPYTDWCVVSAVDGQLKLFESYCLNNSISSWKVYPCPTCQDGACIGASTNLTCSDGTLNYICSITKPKYCNNGTSINNCNSCGCPTNQSCQTDGSCMIVQTISNFSDGSAEKNITINETTQNQTVYVEVPSGANITNATITVTTDIPNASLVVGSEPSIPITPNETVLDISPEINDYITSPPEETSNITGGVIFTDTGKILIPLVFHAEYSGIIKISSIKITYLIEPSLVEELSSTEKFLNSIKQILIGIVIIGVFLIAYLLKLKNRRKK